MHENMNRLKQIFLLVLLILIISNKAECQDYLNIRGKKHISFNAGDFINNSYVVELGFSKYISSKVKLTSCAKYYYNKGNYTEYTRGILQLNGAYKLFNINNNLFIYISPGLFLGLEKLSSHVEDKSLTKFPVYGLNSGIYVEQIIVKNISLNIGTDLNIKYGGTSTVTFYNTKIGLNIYLR